MKRSHAGFTAVILFLTLFTLVVPGAIEAQTPDREAELVGFEPIGDYTLLVDGEESSSAQIHRSQRAGGAILIIDESLGSAFLLSPRSLQVDSVPVENLKRNDDGTVDIPPTATLSRQGAFELTSEAVLFDLGGKSLALQDRAPLLGLQDQGGGSGVQPRIPPWCCGVQAICSHRQKAPGVLPTGAGPGLLRDLVCLLQADGAENPATGPGS